MSVQMTLQGTVRADGSLELDDPVAMPEGRVLVTVRPVVQPASDDPFWQRMEQIWARQRARPCPAHEGADRRGAATSFGTMPKPRCERPSGFTTDVAAPARCARARGAAA